MNAIANIPINFIHKTACARGGKNYTLQFVQPWCKASCYFVKRQVPQQSYIFHKLFINYIQSSKLMINQSLWVISKRPNHKSKLLSRRSYGHVHVKDTPRFTVQSRDSCGRLRSTGMGQCSNDIRQAPGKSGVQTISLRAFPNMLKLSVKGHTNFPVL